jgi:hypothetical protein
LSSSSSWWRKSRQMASTRFKNSLCYPRIRPRGWPFGHKVPSNWGRDTEIQNRSYVLQEGGKASERGVHACLLRPMRGEFWYNQSLFRGLAWRVPWVWWCRISLFVCFLGETWCEFSISYQFYQFFLEGCHFFISSLYLFIYILLLISYKYYKKGFWNWGVSFFNW